MKTMILEKLAEIERNENVRMILAVESGSRAWGFASPDSDYDVRFIYVRPLAEYLKLAPRRDVIEKPVNDLLDVNGWDLDKALRLMYKSNPTLFEWFSSPIRYIDTDLANEIRAGLNRYFNPKHGLYHYLSMATGNYRHYLKADRVRAKKYFYVLRPILACRWILENGTPPPMRFAELVESQLPAELFETVDALLVLKKDAPETKEIDRIGILNDFLDSGIEKIGRLAAELPDKRLNRWDELDRLFRSALDWAGG